jgi:hypothetical protein
VRLHCRIERFVVPLDYPVGASPVGISDDGGHCRKRPKISVRETSRGGDPRRATGFFPIVAKPMAKVQTEPAPAIGGRLADRGVNDAKTWAKREHTGDTMEPNHKTPVFSRLSEFSERLRRRAVTVLRHKPGMNLAAFTEYWRTTHAEAVKRVPKIKDP